VDLERFSPAADSAAVRACHEIYLSGLPADDPEGPVQSLRPFAGWMELGWTEDPSKHGWHATMRGRGRRHQQRGRGRHAA
jgi:hypothetical protein